VSVFKVSLHLFQKYTVFILCKILNTFTV
jgi:hypothetical protein